MTTPDETPAVPAEVAPPAPAAQPAQYQATPQQYAPAPPQAYAAPNPMPNTWMNIVAFVTGLLGMAIIPIVFGHMGVSQSNKGRADYKWMGIVGLVLGYLAVVAWIIVFFAIVVLAAASTTTS